MFARYESPYQTMRYNDRVNQNSDSREEVDQKQYKFRTNDYKRNSRSNSIRYQKDNYQDNSNVKLAFWNLENRGEQAYVGVVTSQIKGVNHQTKQNGLKKGSSLEQLTELISSKQAQSSSRLPSNDAFNNTHNFEKRNSAKNENLTDRQKSLKKIQKDLSSLFNKTQSKNSENKQNFLTVRKQKEDDENNQSEDANYLRIYSENKQSNPIKNKYNALLDVIGSDKTQQSQQQPNQKLEYETIRNYKAEKSDLRKQVEGMVDKIQRKLKEEEEKFQQMQQTSLKNNNANSNNKYQQFLITKVNKDTRMNQTFNQNNISNGFIEKKDDIKQKETHKQQNSGQNQNVTTYGITLQQKENMINRKTEQFFYNAYNQIQQTQKQESEPIIEINTISKSNLNNKTIPNFSAVQTLNQNLTQSNPYYINHEKSSLVNNQKPSSGEESPNIFRVRKVKQNYGGDNSNRLTGGGTLEELEESQYQDGQDFIGSERYDENKKIRNIDERISKDKKNSPKRITMPQNQTNNRLNTSGGYISNTSGGVLNNTSNIKTFYGQNPISNLNTTTYNFRNGSYLNINNNQNNNLSNMNNTQNINMLNNQSDKKKQYQNIVNQMDQLERIVCKLRGQRQWQQEMKRSSSNPTRFQIVSNREMNRVNSEKSLRQNDIDQNRGQTARDESKQNNKVENNNNLQNVIFRPFTTQNVNLNKLKNIKAPTLPTSKDQSSTVDGLFVSNNSFKDSFQNLDRFEIGQVIGQGSYAVVRKAKDVLTDRVVAIKIYDKFRLIDPQKRNNVKREMFILQKLDHKNIIQLLMTVDTKTTVNLVMEYMTSLSLRHFLKSKPNHRLSESEAKFIFKYND